MSWEMNAVKFITTQFIDMAGRKQNAAAFMVRVKKIEFFSKNIKLKFKPQKFLSWVVLWVNMCRKEIEDSWSIK